MHQKSDGMNYAPEGPARRVCRPGEFCVGVIGLDHGHIYGMCNGLIEAGAEVVRVYDPDPEKVAAFCRQYPGVNKARAELEILEDPALQLIAGAPVPCARGPLGERVMDYGKDYFTDKPPLVSFEQLEAVRRKTSQTGRRFAVYYSERLHSEAAVRADQLIREGAIGTVLQVVGLGPHRLNPKSRPAWFWRKSQYGGILCDLGCHQIEQYLHYTGNSTARVLHSKTANFRQPSHPEFEDFGDATLVGANGATLYFRVDWFTPDGLGAWGDGRTFILGTEGYLELRKYLDIARDPAGDHVYLVDRKGEHHLAVHGTVGYPFFGELILDCLHRTEKAMTQDHALQAIDLALQTQAQAVKLEPAPGSPLTAYPAGRE
jgi:predicted dehydrogenase